MTDVASSGGAQRPPKIKVGVLLGPEPAETGGWLADAAAFDAGGADALWVELGPEPELDVLALAAAVAAVTFRARLVVALPASSVEGGGLRRTVDTIARLSHGRLALLGDPDRCAGLGVGIFRRVRGEPGAFEEEDAQRWVSVPVVQGRAAWRAACAAAANHGAQGLVVPADPRLLDMLRNPEEPGDRRDLQLAQG
jgi:hypothetical protein